MYERAAKVAKEKGESAKVRRYNRAVDSIKTMQKQVSETIVWMSGSPVTSLSLPLSPPRRKQARRSTWTTSLPQCPQGEGLRHQKLPLQSLQTSRSCLMRS